MEFVTVVVARDVGRTGALRVSLEVAGLVRKEGGSTVDGDVKVVVGEEVVLVVVGTGAGTTVGVVERVGITDVALNLLVLVLVGKAVTVGSMTTVVVEPLAQPIP